MILDGFGIAKTEGNAIAAAKKPNLDKLFSENPITKIGASGMATAKSATPTSAQAASFIRSLPASRRRYRTVLSLRTKRSYTP